MIYKAFLKWAGGKKNSLALIKNNLDFNCDRYIEPFAGSAVVFLNVNYSEYLVCDVNCDLISLYNIIKEQGVEFIEYCKTFFTSENNTEDKFYELRAKFNSTDGEEEKAALFVYLNRHAFNGLCRYNRKGEYNVPFGRYTANPGFPEREMLHFHSKAEGCEFRCQDFALALSDLNEKDVVYCDPPYVPLSDTASFTSYATDDFTPDDQRRLTAIAEQRKCLFLISNHDTEETRELYSNADQIEKKDINRSISGRAEGRGKVGELLAIYKPF